MRKSYSFQPQLKMDCYHIAQAEALFVKKVTLNDLLSQWVPLNPGKTLEANDAYYAECTKEGAINWKTTKIYTSVKLVGRNNVHVVTYNKEAAV